MDSVIDNLRSALGRLSSKQRIQLILAVVATCGLLWGFTSYVNRVRYGVLFSNMERDDASSIVTELKSRGITHRLSAGGSMIEVPIESIDDLRLDLAGEGLPSGGGVGFELFDKPAFGLSDFVQNVNYRRALERELARTIQSLSIVKTARVHLALPPEAVFADEMSDPSASVVLSLKSNRALSSERVQSIANLVASGVEGLAPERVSIIDGQGRMLSSGNEESGGAMNDRQIEAKRDRERILEESLISILEPIVGRGRVRARATVELNMQRVDRVQESFDPNGAVVLSETKTKSKNQEAVSGGGIPGTASNLPGGATPGGGGGGAGGSSQTTVTNFEISKTVSTVSEPVGGLVRQSVAVVVDHTPAATDGTGDGTDIPRTPAEMRQITQIVQATIGYDVNRGDQLIVQNAPFETALLIDGEGGTDIVGLILKILRLAALPLAVLLLGLLVIRPAMTTFRLAQGSNPLLATDGGPPTVAQLQAQVQAQLVSGSQGAADGPMSMGGDSGSPLRQKLMEAVSEDPQTASLVIRSWLETAAVRARIDSMLNVPLS